MFRHLIHCTACTALLLIAAGCHDQGGSKVNGVIQTRFPGQYTAGGGTSGELIGRASAVNDGKYQTGTPGIASGAGGNTGGVASGGAVQESGHGGSGGSTQTPAPAK